MVSGLNNYIAVELSACIMTFNLDLAQQSGTVRNVHIRIIDKEY